MRRPLAFVLAAALAGALVAAAPAAAQDVPGVISPLRVETDHNGVNLVTGKATLQMPALSVPAAPNLRFDRVQNAAPYVSGTTGGSGGGEGTSRSSYSVHTGQSGSESFKCDDFDCASVTGTGSTFVPNALVFRQAGSGAVWNFPHLHVDTLVNGSRNIHYYASQVSYPNGETLTYAYDTVFAAGRTQYRPARITSNLGYFIALTYQGDTFGTNAWGRVASATLYAGAAPTVPLQRLTYSGDTITDLGGRVYSCTGCSNQMGADIETIEGSLTLPGEASPAVRMTRHPTAPLVASVVKDGTSWTYGYGNPRLHTASNAWRYDSVTVDGPDGFRQVYAIGGLGQAGGERNVILSATDPIGRTSAFHYDAGYRPDLITAPEGDKVAIGYDDNGNVIARSATAKPGSGLAALTETASYPTQNCFTAAMSNLCYRPLWTTDALGRRTDYAWNAQAQLTEQTDPADRHGVRRKTFVEYESSTGLSRRSAVRVCGHGAECGTNREIRTEYLYWGSTLLVSRERRIDAYSGTVLDTLFDYDPAGRLLSKDGPLPGTDDKVFTRYDVHGRKSWEIGARSEEGLRIATRFAWRDSDDRPLYSETGTLPDANSSTLAVFSRTEFTYDSRRNLIRTSVSRSGVTHKVTDQSWDEQGRLVCTAVRMNPDSFGQQPGACEHTTPGTQGPDRITRNEYDAAGQLLRVERAFGTPIRQDYAKFEYTPNGKRKAVIDANGNRAEMTFDGHDRQSRWTFPSNTPGLANAADYEEYGYDPLGNRTSLRKRDGSVLSYQYDNLNRVIRKVVPERAHLTAAQTRDVFYDYDLRGLQTKARFDNLDGEGVTSWYDAFGRPVLSSLTWGGEVRYVSSLFDSAGHRIRLTHPDGAEFGYAWDALGRMTAVQDKASPTSLDDLIVRYGYKPEGPRHAAVRGAGLAGFITVSYYDALQRPEAIINDLPGIANDVNINLAYNPAGQITQRSISNDAYAAPPAYNVARGYQVNGLNQYTGTTHSGAPNWSYEYDPNGNLTRSVDPVGTGTTAYLYDVENRLVSASGAANATLVYDPLGRLVEVTGGPGATTRFLYDGDRLIAEYDGFNDLTKRYVHGPGTDEPVATYGPDLGLANRRYMLPDERGSVAALVNANGSPTTINRYDPWGIPGEHNAGRFQYTGQAWIGELGLYYYKARFYSPFLGRFMQSDPIGYEDQINLYAYVGNDPTNAVDPDGLTTHNCTGSRLCFSDGLAPGRSGTIEQFAYVRPGIGHNRGPVWSAPRPRAPRVGPGGLRAQEAPDGPHTFRVHIGKTDAYLRGRIESGKVTSASTFSDEVIANAALTAAVQKNERYISAWLVSEVPSSKRIEFVSPIPIGRVMDSHFRVQEGYKAVFVLLPYASQNGGDFTVLTGWVEAR